MDLKPFADRVGGARYLKLTTYRRDGTPVGTPVWFVADGDRLLVWTDADSGKVRRIRADGRVGVQTCRMNGTPTSLPAQGTAAILPADDGPAIDAMLRTRYPIARPALRVLNTVAARARRTVRRAPNRPPTVPAYVAIRVETPTPG